jgi:signal transduction histidine kinase
MKRILVIEDEPQIQENIHEILSMKGFYTITASNGWDGLNFAKEEQPDLIICDIQLPELNGYEILKALRQDAASDRIPFIFLTAKAQKSDLRQGMDLGADDYLIKPFTAIELLRAINSQFAKQANIERQTQRKLNELRNNITYSLPHELLTPLVGIINGAQVLRECYDTIDRVESLEMLDAIESSGKRLHTLIKSHLAYAELELIATNPQAIAALQATPTYCDSKPILSQVATQKARERDRADDLQTDLQDALIDISAEWFQQVLEALIDNAFKFSLPGSPVRIVSSFAEQILHVFVIDHGRGMTTEEIAAIGAYMQFQSNFHKEHGTGLGLMIAQRIVDLYKGEFAIESFPGQQTIVRISFPIAQF